jgi:hypothetical protein
MPKFEMLVKMKKQKEAPTRGDVFVIQAHKDIYFYGKVIKENDMFPTDSFWKNTWIVYLYKKMTHYINYDINLKTQDLLETPIILGDDGWQKGYYLTIKNEAVTDDELGLKYGFKSYLPGFSEYISGKIFDSNGKITVDEPDFISTLMITTYGGVSNIIHKYISDNPQVFGEL